MNPFNTKKNINLKTNKEPESKIENIPSKINLNSSETNKDLKPTKFLTIKIVPFRIIIKIKIKMMIQKKIRIQKTADGP